MHMSTSPGGCAQVTRGRTIAGSIAPGCRSGSSPEGWARQLHQGEFMTAHQTHLSLAAVATTPTPMNVSLRGPENRAIGRLASLVGNVVTNLEEPSMHEPLSKVVAECNAALEGCLEAQRDFGDRDDAVMTASDELKRLARLLMVVDRTDVVIIMRQIRRVLGRFDAPDA
jgi:hypothetical protein